MWVELLTDRINNELGKSNLINEHALIPEPFPLKSQEWQHQVSPNNNKYKKIYVQGKIKWKKIHARQLTLKNIHAMALKKSYKEFDNDKKFLRLENSPSPHNFSNGPSLIERKVYENQSKIT